MRTIAWYSKFAKAASHFCGRPKVFALAVDDGEPMVGINRTPLLYGTRSFNRDHALEQFLSLSSEVPADIVTFVEARLRVFNGPLSP